MSDPDLPPPPDESPDESPVPAVPPVLGYQTPGSEQTGWVKVWTAGSTMEANLAVATLQESGIHARVDMENVATLGAWAGGVGTSTAVHVLRADAEAARKLIDEIEQRRADRVGAGKLACPKCGSHHSKRVMSVLRWIGWTSIVLGIAAGLLNVPALAVVLIVLGPTLLIWPLTPRWRCQSCGHHWIAPEPAQKEEEDDDEAEDDGTDEDDD